MSIKEMTKEQYIKYRIEQGMSKEDIEAKYTEFEEQAKDFGMEGDEILDYVKKRFVASMAKKKRSPRDTFYGVVTIQNLTDFGAQQEYDKAKEAYQEDPNVAIELGLVDEEGDPIWNTPNQDWKHRQKIIPQKELRNDITGIALTEKIFNENATKNAEEKTPYKKLNLRLQRDSLKNTVPMFALVKFEANIKSKTNNVEYFLSGNEETKFEIIKEFDKNTLNVFLNEHYSENIINMEDLATFAAEKAGDYSDKGIAFIKAGLTDIVITDDVKKSNIIVINDPYDESVLPITCWTPKNIDCKFSGNADEILIVGRVTTGDQLSINVRGVWVDPRFKVKSDQQGAEKMLDNEDLVE